MVCHKVYMNANIYHRFFEDKKEKSNKIFYSKQKKTNTIVYKI